MSKNVKKWIFGIIILAIIIFAVNMCVNRGDSDIVPVDTDQIEMNDDAASDAVEESVVKEVEVEEVKSDDANTEEATDEKTVDEVEEDSTADAEKTND